MLPPTCLGDELDIVELRWSLLNIYVDICEERIWSFWCGVK